jgi:hypothetical protein
MRRKSEDSGQARRSALRISQRKYVFFRWMRISVVCLSSRSGNQFTPAYRLDPPGYLPGSNGQRPRSSRTDLRVLRA